MNIIILTHLIYVYLYTFTSSMPPYGNFMQHNRLVKTALDASDNMKYIFFLLISVLILLLAPSCLFLLNAALYYM